MYILIYSFMEFHWPRQETGEVVAVDEQQDAGISLQQPVHQDYDLQAPAEPINGMLSTLELQ